MSTTSLFIFISYVINATYAFIYSVADAGDYSSTCPTLCDASCQVPAVMLNHVLRLTPALTSSVMLAVSCACSVAGAGQYDAGQDLVHFNTSRAAASGRYRSYSAHSCRA